MTPDQTDEDEEFLALADTRAWRQFYAANNEALQELANESACNQSLMIGGGASPLIRVGFID